MLHHSLIFILLLLLGRCWFIASIEQFGEVQQRRDSVIPHSHKINSLLYRCTTWRRRGERGSASLVADNTRPCLLSERNGSDQNSR